MFEGCPNYATNGKSEYEFYQQITETRISTVT